jgi:competence protein ComEC
MGAAPQKNNLTEGIDASGVAASRRVSKSSLLPRRQPFFYLMVALTSGILADRWSVQDAWPAAVLALLSIIFSSGFIARRRDAAATAALLVSFAAIGAMLSSADRADVARSRLKHLFETGEITAADPVELTGMLTAPPEPAHIDQAVAAYYLDLRADSVRARDTVTPATGRARLLIALADDESKGEYESLGLGYGSRVRVLVRLERARSYGNPGSVDFNDFLERQGYDLKGTIKSPLLVEKLGVAPVNRGLSFLYSLRLGLMEAIDSDFSQPAAGTLKAMLAGSRYFISRETAERLREGATFHTLVISGFHVGIIAWALLRMRVSVRPRGRSRRSTPRRQTFSRTAIALVALWAYTLMVGMAPPVTRATVMITAGLVAPLLFRRAASINTVSLAAFLMLALEPALVADPAFQLSFVAVAAIVGLALPLVARLREIGEWRPSPSAPRPPSCSRRLRTFAESLFWDERAFAEEMRRSPIRYRLDKSSVARALSRLRLQWLARAVVALAITSAAIQIATLPLAAVYFNRVAPVGILLNIVASLLTAFLMLSALAALAIGAVLAPLAALFKSLVYAAHYLLVYAVVPFAEIPGATFRVAHYEGWPSIVYALYFAPLVAIAILIDRLCQGPGAGGHGAGKREFEISNRRVRSTVSAMKSAINPTLIPSPRPLTPVFCALVLLAFVIAVIRPAAPSPGGKLVVHFLDVGQGDSSLVVFPRGATMLVDAGGDINFGSRAPDGLPAESVAIDSGFSIGESVVSRFLWSQGMTGLDYAVVTHADRDHVGGFSDVTRNFQVGQAITGTVPSSDEEFNGLARSLARHGVPLARVGAGSRFELEGVTVEVLWPEPATGQRAASGNDDSVVLRLIYGSTSILLAGDIERRTEEALVGSGIDLGADVLKVPHHGSKTSSTEAFLDRVRPRVAIVSVGERSRFGHPHQEVVARYLARGTRLLQTGRDGMITVETDGATLAVSAHREPKR